MSTLDSLIHEIDARYYLGEKANPFVREAYRLVINHSDGVGGLVRRLRAAGFGVEVDSWLGRRDLVPLSGEEIERTLGGEAVAKIADKADVSQRFARTILGYAIPNIIVLLARRETLPEVSHAAASRFLGSAGGRPSFAHEEGSPAWRQQTGAGRTDDGSAASVLGGLIIPGATALIVVGSLLAYFIGAGDRGVVPLPISAQLSPAKPLYTASVLTPLPFSNESNAFIPVAGDGGPKSAVASWALFSAGEKKQAGAHQPAPKFAAVYFAPKSAKVKLRSKPLVLKAARLIKQLPAGTVIEIGGYTDNVGSPISNMQLSQRRARAVLQALTRAGVKPSMLIAKGYGDSNSQSADRQNGTIEGRSTAPTQDRWRNGRRVEFSIRDNRP